MVLYEAYTIYVIVWYWHYIWEPKATGVYKLYTIF